jgi:hypothetical protein
MFKIARRLSFTATSTDRSVLAALDHVLAHQHLTRPLVADTHPTGTDENGELVRLDLSFAPWLKTVYSREQPRMLVRRHFEAMVFTCLVEELRCGDVAVNGAEYYGDWTRMLLPWEQCEPKLVGFCEQAGFPATASEFTVRLRERLTTIAETVDAGYPDNKDLTIDPVTGVPSLALRRAGERTASAEKLEEALSERHSRPQCAGTSGAGGALDGLVGTARPALGQRAEAEGTPAALRDHRVRLRLRARPCPGRTPHAGQRDCAHELGAIAKRHFTIPVLNRCGADVVNAHAGLDLTAAWGDGSVAAVDGTMMDTVIESVAAGRGRDERDRSPDDPVRLGQARRGRGTCDADPQAAGSRFAGTAGPPPRGPEAGRPALPPSERCAEGARRPHHAGGSRPPAGSPEGHHAGRGAAARRRHPRRPLIRSGPMRGRGARRRLGEQSRHSGPRQCAAQACHAGRRALVVVDRFQAAHNARLPLSGDRLPDASQVLAGLARTLHVPVLAVVDSDDSMLLGLLDADVVVTLEQTEDPSKIQVTVAERDFGAIGSTYLRPDLLRARFLDAGAALKSLPTARKATRLRRPPA